MDLGEMLAMHQRSRGGGRPAGIRRTKSNNPAKVGVNEALRRPTVATEADVGVSTRTVGSPQLPAAAQLSLFDAAELGIEPDKPEVDAADRTEVLSPPSTIAPDRPRAREARYDPDTKVLTVRFRHGGTYAYEGVPLRTWRALQRNKSFGKTLDRLVINQYPFRRVSY